MVSDQKKLQLNVNLNSLQPGFINQELHYVFATDELNFRFVNWDDMPGADEEKFYCYLTAQELTIPAGNISLQQCYVLSREAPYQEVSDATDFKNVISSLSENESKKCIRRFKPETITDIANELKGQFTNVQLHQVQSDEATHTLLVVDNVEASVSATMLYFRHKAPFSEEHYEHASEEGLLE